jgi:spore germination protein GerM
VNRARLLIGLTLCVAVFVLAGCAESPAINQEPPKAGPVRNNSSIYEGEARDRVLLYFIKDNFLVPVTLGVEPTREPAKTALSLLFSEAPAGFENKLSGVKIKGFSIANDTATIDVSGEFLKGEEVSFRKAQLVFTLTEFDDIHKVRISVDGKPLEDVLERPQFINVVEKDSGKPVPMVPVDESGAYSSYITVYYADKMKDYIVPVTVKSQKIVSQGGENHRSAAPAPEDRARAALELLIEGPRGLTNLTGIFPKDIKIKDFYIKDGIAYVDVSKNLITRFVDKVDQEKIAVESVVQTLTNIEDIEKVQFLIDGNVMGTITGHTNISAPISRMKFYNFQKKQ